MDFILSNSMLIFLGILTVIILFFILKSRAEQMKQKQFRLNKKYTIIVIFILFTVYTSLAIIETKSKSYSSVDEAFDNLLVLENFEPDNIASKVISIHDDYAVILFHTGNRFALSLFEEGLFGWRLASYSIGNKSNSISRTSNLITGWIPDNYNFDTKNVLLNDNKATIIELDNNNRAWLFIDNKSEIKNNNLNIRYIDTEGNVVNTFDN